MSIEWKCAKCGGGLEVSAVCCPLRQDLHASCCEAIEGCKGMETPIEKLKLPSKWPLEGRRS